MKEKTIGKIEIILSILLVVLTIIVAGYYIAYVDDLGEQIDSNINIPSEEELNNYGNETRVILIYEYLSLTIDNFWSKEIAKIIIICSSGIMMSISIFLLLEGVSRISTKEKLKW